MGKFLVPSIKHCESLEKLLSSPEGSGFFSFRSHGNLDDMLARDKIILAGDPGYGKSRILREVVMNSEQKGKSGIYLDLKSFSKHSLEDVITSNDITLGSAIDPMTAKIFQTKTFVLTNSTDVTVCLDALDEVSQDDFSNIVEEIKTFNQKYSKTQIILSCRRSYLAKWQHLFADQKFSYYHLLCLSHDQIQNFLIDQKLDRDQIDLLLDKTRLGDRFPLVRVPRYLEMVAKFVQNKGLDALSGATKSSLFEFIIDTELTNEARGSKLLNYKPIVRKVLEKLALVMEIYQTNVIQKSELMVFFDDVKSNLNISLLGQVPLEFFYSRCLIKEGPDTIEFVNTEFQEYLASLEIVNLGRTDQVVFDLMIVEQLREIHPSWMNVLVFLLERNAGILVNLIKNTALELGLEDNAKLLPTVGINEFSREDKKMIFFKVLNSFKESGHWIGYDVAERLSKYYDKSFHQQLNRGYLATHKNLELVEVWKANSLLLSGYLAEEDLLTKSQRDTWKRRLVAAIESPYRNEVMPRFALLALAKFKDGSVLTTGLVDTVYRSGQDTIISNLVYAFEEVGIDTNAALHCILKGIKQNNVSARHAIAKMKTYSAINQLVDGMIADKNIAKEFLHHEGIYEKDTEDILLNISRVLDVPLMQKLKALLDSFFSTESWYDAEHSTFVPQLAILINKHSSGYLFELINKHKNSTRLHAYSNIFRALLEEKDVKCFISELAEHEWIMFPVLRSTISNDGVKAKKIESIARELLPKQFAQFDESTKRLSSKDSTEEKKVYQQFKFKLQPQEKQWMEDLFRYYLDNKVTIDEVMTHEERDRLAYLAVEDILVRFDPGPRSLRYTSKTENNSIYTTHQYVYIFGDALKVAHAMHLNVFRARQNIINYIPFAYNEHLEIILELINKPTENELSGLVNIYKGRADDLPIFMPISFIRFAGRHKFAQALPILKMFVNSREISDYDRSEAFQIAVSLIGDPQKYVRKVFKDSESDASGKSSSLADAANAYLITHYADPEAIEWRVGCIFEQAAPFMRAKGAHFIGNLESEIDDMTFAKPLFSLKERQHKEIFVRILDKALDLLEQGDDYEGYASYLWSIAINYYKNLKQERSYGPLRDLESFIKKNKHRRGINWFAYKYQNLKRDYMIFVAKPSNIADCIKKYNKFKEMIYLDIGTEQDLYERVRKVLEDDIRSWVEGGAYSLILSDRRTAEDFIQKTIVPKIESCFMYSGLRRPELPREVQTIDNKRTDLLAYYGFIGPVLIELKLSDNDEITNPKKRLRYKAKLNQYLQATGARRGIYLVFKVKNIHNKYIDSLRNQYAVGSIEVVDISCLKKDVVEEG